MKSLPETKPMCYSPRKKPEITKSTFKDIAIFVYRGSRAVEIALGPQTYVLWPMKTAINDQIDEF